MAHGREEIALEAVRLVQGHVRLGQLIDFQVKVAVHLPQTVLHAQEVTKHAVESVAQVFELVARLDFAADVELASRDGVADFLQMLDRLDDDIADNQVAAGHEEDRGNEGGGDQQRPVFVNTAFDLVSRDLDLDQGHQVAGLQTFFVEWFLGSQRVATGR